MTTTEKEALRAHVAAHAAHGGYFQLPEKYGRRVLGKHGFNDWVHATRNSPKIAQFV